MFKIAVAILFVVLATSAGSAPYDQQERDDMECFAFPFDRGRSISPRQWHFAPNVRASSEVIRLATIGEFEIRDPTVQTISPPPPEPAWFIEIRRQGLDEILKKFELMKRLNIPLPRPRPKDLGKK